MPRMITNTSKKPRTEWLFGRNPEAIESQERQGQAEILTSDVLPVDGSEDPEILDLGIEFGPICEGDPLFRRAVLPDGWSKRSGWSSFWVDLVDRAGITRAKIFYKAAFYDRKAFIRKAD